ncbi:MAG TPA: T9SS type A sorting domain-containing protein [Ignavibacteria bacterium]|nr:T9SS type A sorting domain-containing protein [Ignavibacteria bacterium]
MKKNKTFYSLLVLVSAIFIFNSISYARIINVSVANFSFSPSSISNAVVGDTIKWNWVSGGHTTTCDGSQFTSRPAGAASWDANINSGSPTFRYVITVAGNYSYKCNPHAPEMVGTITATVSSISQTTELVNGYKISQNYPNPFNPSTKINFSIPYSSQVILKIYNNSGQQVAALVNERLNASSYEVEWDAADFNSGIYYYKIQAGNFSETKKMLLIK